MTDSTRPGEGIEHEQAETAADREEQRRDSAAEAEELVRLHERLRHATEQWTRCEADLQNYRKRIEKERREWVQSGLAALVRSLLPILDDLDRAFQTLPPMLIQLTWTEGVALVDRKLVATLEQHGLKEISALGQLFDPAHHQAILEGQTKDVPDGHVMAVLQKGYLFGDRVLRPALVQVAHEPLADTSVADSNVGHATDETAQSSLDSE